MEATVRLPDALAHRLERIAKQEGISIGDLIRRLVSEHLERRHPLSVSRNEIQFPLIPKQETGVVYPVTGAGLDEMFAREELSS
jgi:hypothetical protein